MHWFAILHRLSHGADSSSLFNIYNLLGTAGCMAWLVAYILIILRAGRDRSYGVPMMAICLNITWELLAALGPAPVPVWHVLEILWLVFDGIILYQLLRYGRRHLVVPGLEPVFIPLIISCLVLAGLWQYAWREFFDDKLLFIDAFMINFVMSALFIYTLFIREDLHGLSWGAAWAKMIGTAFTSIRCYVLLPRELAPSSSRQSWLFMDVLYVSIFVLDLIYIALFAHRRRVLLAEAIRDSRPPQPCLGTALPMTDVPTSGSP